MSNRTISLRTYFVPKEDGEMRKGLVSLFDGDEDFNGGNGDEYWEMTDQEDEDGELISLAVSLGFETEAERFVDEIFSTDEDDLTNIQNVLDRVESCLGSYGTQFTTKIDEVEGGYSIAVAYLY